MSDTDLSDEAWSEWFQGNWPPDGETPTAKEAWQECRRRANEAYRTNEIKWMNIVSKMRQDFENERREAFEAGYYSVADNVEIGYRAFLQERERK